jgi:hypothetical protein
MSLIDLLANKIARALRPHEEPIRHIQALFLWNRPVLFIGAIELLF